MTEHSLFPFKREDRFDPPSAYARLRQEHPIFPVTLWDGARAWLVTRYDDVRAICNDPRFTAEMGRPGFPSVTEARRTIDMAERAFIGMDNPRHDHYRRMFTKEFSAKRMLGLRPMIERIAGGLVSAFLRTGRPADLVEGIAVKLPALVICGVFGSPYEDHVFISECAAGRHGLTQSTEDAARTSNALIDYSAELIRRKEREPGDDLISRIIAEYIKPGLLSREEFANIGSLLLRAGHDTTTNLISLGTLLLLLHPDQADELRADPALVEPAVEEMLRYLSPVQFQPRRMALEDVELHGTRIAKGEGLFLLNTAANRDPDIFPEPDRFDIHRDASAHLAFGYGIHQCLGQTLARIELHTIFKEILRRIPSLRLAVPLEEVVFREDRQIYGLYRLPVAWDEADMQRAEPVGAALAATA